LIVDSSVLLPYLVDDGAEGARAREVLGIGTMAAPELIDLEIASAIRGLHRSGQLSEGRARSAIDDLRATDVDRVPHLLLLPRIWELRDNLTAYDAAYVALAERFDEPLVTADRGIASAPGVRCEISLVE
jgi:predicted nucleic acid-binding protein